MRNIFENRQVSKFRSLPLYRNDKIRNLWEHTEGRQVIEAIGFHFRSNSRTHLKLGSDDDSFSRVEVAFNVLDTFLGDPSQGIPPPPDVILKVAHPFSPLSPLSDAIEHQRGEPVMLLYNGDWCTASFDKVQGKFSEQYKFLVASVDGEKWSTVVHESELDERVQWGKGDGCGPFKKKRSLSEFPSSKRPKAVHLYRDRDASEDSDSDKSGDEYTPPIELKRNDAVKVISGDSGGGKNSGIVVQSSTFGNDSAESSGVPGHKDSQIEISSHSDSDDCVIIEPLPKPPQEDDGCDCWECGIFEKDVERILFCNGYLNAVRRPQSCKATYHRLCIPVRNRPREGDADEGEWQCTRCLQRDKEFRDKEADIEDEEESERQASQTHSLLEDGSSSVQMPRMVFGKRDDFRSARAREKQRKEDVALTRLKRKIHAGKPQGDEEVEAGDEADMAIDSSLLNRHEFRRALLTRARASQSQEDKVGIGLQEVRLDRYFASEIKAHQLAGIRFLYSHVVVGLKNLREVISS